MDDDESRHGLWIVTTPLNGLHTGDVVRVVWQEPPTARCYLVRRAGCTDANANANAIVTRNMITLPTTHLFAIHIPTVLMEPMENMEHMEPFLVRASHLVPPGGWMAFLRDAGVGTHFTHPRSWQFYAKCWDEDVLTGKTGGLHMSLYNNNSRRCQLLVEYGVTGDSLVDTLPHTRQGVLMYVSNMNTEAASRTGDVCYETSTSLSFSALLLAYAETLSLVRRAVYEHPTHPCGGTDYAARVWDYTHVPYTHPFPVACAAENPPRTVNIAEFASKKAKVWLAAENAANPDAWALPPPLDLVNVHVGMRMPMRLVQSGVTVWVNAKVTGVKPLAFDVPVTSNCLMGVIDSQFVTITID